MFADIFRNNVHASGVVPQISLIMGPCAGGAAYSPALTDYVIMVDKTSHMFITGPDVIKTVTGEEVDMETLGGARQHNATTGTATYLATDEQDAIEFCKELLEFLPSNNISEAPSVEFDEELELTAEDLELDTLIPDSANQPYDMRKVIEHIVDDGIFLEMQSLYAPNVMIGYARVEGSTIGIVANQPMQFAGTLDIAASEKAARFVRNCDAFNIPILTLVDVPGFLPGKDQEFQGIIRRGAKLLYAYAEATVPKLTVITRKAYGGAYIVMGSKKLGADINLAWPTAQIGVMGAQGAVNILYRRDLAAVAAEGGDVEARRTAIIEGYEAELLNPYQAAELGYVDAVIAPSDTRLQIVRGLRATARQARGAAGQEAREHPAVTGNQHQPGTDRQARPCASRTAPRPPRKSPRSPRSSRPCKARLRRRSPRPGRHRAPQPHAAPAVARQRPAAVALGPSLTGDTRRTGRNALPAASRSGIAFHAFPSARRRWLSPPTSRPADRKTRRK